MPAAHDRLGEDGGDDEQQDHRAMISLMRFAGALRMAGPVQKMASFRP